MGTGFLMTQAFIQSVDDDLVVDNNQVSQQHFSKVCSVLTGLKVDQEILDIFTLFHAHRTSNPNVQTLIADLDSPRKQMLDDLIKIHQADWLTDPKSNNSEGLRRLLFAMINDVRLVLILLAEQLILMRAAIGFDVSSQKKLASSTMTYHAALANRLGVWQIKWELEDLAFRFLDPDKYKEIASQLVEKRQDRELFITSCSEQLKKTLLDNGINSDIAGRPKHIYSIYRKMQKKQLNFENLFDIRAIRVLVDNVAECYATLGIVHGIWNHIPKEFDDYIAQPKGNMYQSLHTVVIAGSGKTLEVQIRTGQMHEHAELGVAAHWRYKDGSKQDQFYDEKVNWMRQLLLEGDSSSDLLEQFQSETQEERIYVFTPTGDVIDLPRGSTPVDFAYHVHTEVGHRCQGAKINGSIVPLTYQMETGDRVEVLTSKLPKPSRDWLYEQSGYLQSGRARAKVRNWFRNNDFEKNQHIGKDMLDGELKKYSLQKVDLNLIIESFNLHQVDKLYAMVATGDISINQILRKADQQLNPARKVTLKASVKPINKKIQSSYFLVEGLDSLKTSVASCCKPVSGDLLGGFITRTRGISIHKANCDNYIHMISEEPNRLINVKWNKDNNDFFSAALAITANDRKSFIKDLSSILANQQANIEAITTYPDSEAGLRHIEIVIQVRDFEHLTTVINRISSVEHLISIQRKT